MRFYGAWKGASTRFYGAWKALAPIAGLDYRVGADGKAIWPEEITWWRRIRLAARCLTWQVVYQAGSFWTNPRYKNPRYKEHP